MRSYVLWVITASTLAACVGPSAPRPSAASTPAVSLLVTQSEVAMADNHPNLAEGLLERALRIAPADPRPWHDLAVLRLPTHAREALDMAQKSNTLAAHDPALRRANWAVIAQAWTNLGQPEQAAAANAEAAQVEFR